MAYQKTFCCGLQRGNYGGKLSSVSDCIHKFIAQILVCLRLRVCVKLSTQRSSERLSLILAPLNCPALAGRCLAEERTSENLGISSHEEEDDRIGTMPQPDHRLPKKRIHRGTPARTKNIASVVFDHVFS